MNAPKIKLNNGVFMPIEGFGVFQIPDAAQCLEAVRCALKTGYRLIDTASVYDNEGAVGKAINESVINRSEFFLTTKVWTSQMGYDRTMKAFENSLKRLGQDYLDLYLVHMPYGDVAGTWRAMEQLYHEGRIRSIGVCNFSEAHLTDLCLSVEIKPMVNQVECHPFTQQTGMLALCRETDIQLEAWAPFAEGKMKFLIILCYEILHIFMEKQSDRSYSAGTYREVWLSFPNQLDLSALSRTLRFLISVFLKMKCL